MNLSTEKKIMDLENRLVVTEGVVFGVVLGWVFGGVPAVDFGRVYVALPHCKKRSGGAGSGAGPAG